MIERAHVIGAGRVGTAVAARLAERGVAVGPDEPELVLLCVPDRAIAEVKGGAPIFVGPLKDNTGKLVIEGTLGLYDGALWGTDYLLEGIVGSIT